MSVTTRFRNLDWLIVVLVSWILPLGLIPRIRVSYFNSLMFWLVPIVCLLPRFLRLTHPGSRRRRALVWSTLQIVLLGAGLDLLFGHQILQFDSKSSGTYVGLYLPAVGMEVPIEEMLFYVLSFPAILLVYFWFDEYWLALYNRQDRRLTMDASTPLVGFSRTALAWGAALFVAGVVLKHHWSGGAAWFPKYYTFLLVGLVPAALVSRTVVDLINWPAFTITSLYILSTSMAWEATLAIPLRWWGYRPEAMLGKMIDVWTRDPAWPFPLEAFLVWIAAPFVSIFNYEAVKAYHYHPHPSKWRRVLPGAAPARVDDSSARRFVD